MGQRLSVFSICEAGKAKETSFGLAVRVQILKHSVIGLRHSRQAVGVSFFSDVGRRSATVGLVGFRELDTDRNLSFHRTMDLFRGKADKGEFFSEENAEGFEAVALFFVSTGYDPDGLVVKVLVSLILVERIDGKEIRFHIVGVAPEPTDRVKGLGNLFLNGLGYVFLGEIGPVFHFPGKKVFGVFVEGSTFTVFGFPYDFKPHLGEGHVILSGGINRRVEMYMRCPPFLKFETPQVIEGSSTETAFDSFLELPEVFLDDPAIDRPGVMIGAAILRADMVSRVPADEKQAALGFLGELKNVATFPPVGGVGLEDWLFYDHIGVIDLEPVPAVWAVPWIHPQDFRQVEGVTR